MALIHPIALTWISVYCVTGFPAPFGLCLTLGYFLPWIVFEVESEVFHPPFSNYLAPLFLREVSKQDPRLHHLDPLLSADCWLIYFPSSSLESSSASISFGSTIVAFLSWFGSFPIIYLSQSEAVGMSHLASDYKERWPFLHQYSIIGFPHLVQFFFP